MTPLTIAIVGRPNVGKSTIFNRLVGERISIVEDTPGVTRDRIFGESEWLGRKLNWIDTGGIAFDQDNFAEEIRMQANIAMEEANCILMLTDGQDGVTREDEMIAKLLRKSDKPVFLAVNKIDNTEMRQEIYDFYRLGLGDPYPVSGAHSLGFGDLLSSIYEAFPVEEDDEQEDETISFAFIGRPNVGKSSLVNALLNENRVIVSDIAGTTRDAVDTFFETEDHRYRIIDTAGLRKRGKVSEKIEKYSNMRAMSAIERSNVAVLVLNAEEGIQDQDLNIVNYALEEGKGVIILVNKWDAIDKDNHTMDDFNEQLKGYFRFMEDVPVLYVSAKTGQRLNQLLPMITRVNENTHRRVQSSVLNEVLLEAIRINPAPTDKGKKLRVYYMTQVAIEPPTFVVMVNDKKRMHFTYERFLTNEIRKAFDFTGSPIRLIVRERS